MEWIKTSDRLPITYQTGDWDGLKSDLCLCLDEKGDFYLACCYEYVHNEIEWYDKDDYGLRHNVTHWAEIEKPKPINS